MNNLSILIAERDTVFLQNMGTSLGRAGHRIYEAAGVAEAADCLLEQNVQVAVLGLTGLGRGALDIVKLATIKNPCTEVLVLTTSDTISLSIAAMKMGAFDDILLPVRPDLLLKRIKEAGEAGTRKNRKKRSHKMEKFKVLLVDDEEDFVTSLGERLKLREVNAQTALSGEAALELVSDEVPDVMVLDLRMPGVDGMEVLKRVKSKYPDVEVVMLTGHGSEKDEEEARRHGVLEYLQKPVKIETLMDTLKKAFRNKVENAMTAAAFAEAGDFETAKDIIKG